MKHQQINIYGNGGHSRIVQDVLKENGFLIKNIFNTPLNQEKGNSLTEEAIVNINTQKSKTQKTPSIIAITNNDIRLQVSEILTTSNFQSIKHPSAVVATGVNIGEGSVILAQAVIQPNTRIGKHVIINTGVSVDHDNTIEDYVHISSNATLTNHVSVGEGSHIGAGAVIISGVKIGKWCSVGAGAVIANDIPDYCTVAGNPGRIIKREPPAIVSNHTFKGPFDIAFVGAGISTAYTLLQFLEDPQFKGKNLKIAVIEKKNEFFTGIPYGKRSGDSTLLLSPLREFLPPSELIRFTEWLKLNKDWLLKRVSKDGGARTNEWIVKNKKALDKDKWGSLYIPRSFFGYYTQERLQNAMVQAKRLTLTEVFLIREEILSMKPLKSGYNLISRATTFYSEKVILGIGAPRMERLKTYHVSTNKNQKSLVITNPYDKGINNTIKSILHFVSKPHKRKPDIVLLGANASALEILYKLNDFQGIDKRVNSYTLLSTHSSLARSVTTETLPVSFTPKHTLSLRSVQNLTARTIAEAVNKDLEDAEAMNIDRMISGEPITKAFKPLIQALDVEEKEIFTCVYGNEIGRRQRATGCHYTRIIGHLKNEKRLRHIKGTFQSLAYTDQQPLTVRYFDPARINEQISEIAADVVINCLGAVKLNDPEAPPIIHDLVNTNKVRINPSQLGLRVNQDLEILPGVHIIGPLLTGNVIEGNPIWHAEHCGRVIDLTRVLAKKLIEDYRDQNDSDSHLVVHQMDNEQAILTYKKLLEQYENHPYYKYEYFGHHREGEGKLIILELRNQHQSFCIMPILKRTLNSENFTGYYDVTSPYGYNGPLYNLKAPSGIKQRFWKLVNEWYGKEKIVSEFIRFNYLQNHEAYNGELLPTLNNVKGKILEDPHEQWKQFKTKVRNNYRKAKQEHLDFRAFSGSDITAKHIKDFHSIYIETMDRNHASSSYFFNLEYFRNLIGSDPDSFILAFAHKEETIASAELIILHHDTMFAFLGGTRQALFASRPNDFLRVEIIELGRKKGILWYILGGGIKDLDGLYKSKKYLFPNDEDFTFYTGRKIVDREIYQKLCEEKGIDMFRASAFFPHYRSKRKLPELYR